MLILEEVEDPHPLNTRILERKDTVATIVFFIILNTLPVNLKYLKTSFLRACPSRQKAGWNNALSSGDPSASQIFALPGFVG